MNQLNVDSNIIEYELINKATNKIKIFFDKKSLELKGMENNRYLLK